MVEKVVDASATVTTGLVIRLLLISLLVSRAGPCPINITWLSGPFAMMLTRETAV
jgi:hypothetical protein